MNTAANNFTHKTSNVSPYQIGFLLLEEYSLIALASAVEPLRMANQLSGKTLYRWYLMSTNGKSVRASDGIKVAVDVSITTALDLDILIVVGGTNVANHYNKKEIRWLKKLSANNVMIGGACTGAYLLADAGLLNGYDCSVHWEYLATMQETFPKVKSNRRLFTHDNDRLTCSGGGAPMDMFLYIITTQHGSVFFKGVVA